MASSNNSLQYIKISKEDLIEAGVLLEEPNIQESAGPSVKENKFTMIKIDEKYLEECRMEAAQPCYSASKGFHRPSSFSRRESGANRVYDIKKSTTTISRRTTKMKQDITKKCKYNTSAVSEKDVQNNGELKFIPMPAHFFETLENEFSKANVRKELFKMPVTKAKSNIFKSRPTLSGNYIKAPRTSIRSTINNSPLLDMDKVESVLKKNSSLKALGNPQPHLSVQTPSRLSTVEEEGNSLTPSTSGNTSRTDCDNGRRSSTSSNIEFEAMEKMCNNQEATMVNDEINKILDLIKTDEEQFQNYKKARDEKMAKIKRILHEIVTKSVGSKTSEGNIENLQSKPKTPNGTQFKTGVISKKNFDLRKSILSKSLANTPKRQKAEIMYNSLRDKYCILETPKFDRKTPTNGSISARIQEQCLMLLDTPQAKK